MIVAIDGPAGSGKSTVARILAERLKFTYIETGSMYRAVAWKVDQLGLDPKDEAKVAEVARDIQIEFHPLGEGAGQQLIVDGQDLTGKLKTVRWDWSYRFGFTPRPGIQSHSSLGRGKSRTNPLRKSQLRASGFLGARRKVERSVDERTSLLNPLVPNRDSGDPWSDSGTWRSIRDSSRTLSAT